MRTATRIRRFALELADGAGASRDPLAEGVLDSLAIEQLISFLEDQFDVVLEDEDLVAENFARVERVAELVDAKRRHSG